MNSVNVCKKLLRSRVGTVIAPATQDANASRHAVYDAGLAAGGPSLSKGSLTGVRTMHSDNATQESRDEIFQGTAVKNHNAFEASVDG
jgi:hypothetical protein